MSSLGIVKQPLYFSDEECMVEALQLIFHITPSTISITMIEIRGFHLLFLEARVGSERMLQHINSLLAKRACDSSFHPALNASKAEGMAAIFYDSFLVL